MFIQVLEEVKRYHGAYASDLCHKLQISRLELDQVLSMLIINGYVVCEQSLDFCRGCQQCESTLFVKIGEKCI